jgi:hypothetical protein
LSEQPVSAEASVAGEAAAAAVEELHAREAVVDAAETAEVEASIAAGTAEEAREEATAAAETSAVAVGAAVEAQQTAEEAAGIGLSAHEQLAGVRQELTEIRPMLAEMYQDWRDRKDAESAEPVVEEVPVNDRAAADNANGGAGKDSNQANDSTQSSASGSASSSGTSTSTGRRNGLRRRH